MGKEISKHDTGKVYSIRYKFGNRFISFNGGRNSIIGKSSHWNKPYANFNASIGYWRILILHAWVNNEHHSWGLYYSILRRWTFGNGRSCYGQNTRGKIPHCDIRGSIIPTLRRSDKDY